MLRNKGDKMAQQRIQSIEPKIADLANGWLKSYGLDYKLQQEPLNSEIDKALSDYYSKNGGTGGNLPDAKLLLQDKKLNYFPVLIEYKGYKDKLEKLDNNGQVENRKSNNEPHFNNINAFAVNGAVHYANALLHHTNFTDIIAIGMTGHKDEEGKIQHEIGVYYVSKKNLGAGQKVGEFSDLSFLKKEHFDAFIERVNNLSLNQEEMNKLKEQREREIDASLVKLNNDIYNNEKGLGENDRVYLVAASIIATLGIPGKVSPLEKSELKSSTEKGNTDGEIIVRKIEAFLDEKNLPKEKKKLVIRTLENTLTAENLNKVENGESQLKRVFTKIVDDLGIYYKIGLTTDFTGKLFNEMYGWLGFTQDKLNDVVLTPSYVATLLVKLARVNKDSYVWDFATGSAGLLVAAMNEMLIDAKENIKSPDEFAKKEATIKAEQLLGLELLPSIYMLAILNMILMGDGSSNILNKDSIKDFDGKYPFGKTDTEFPANAFVLNPPYSAEGKGMVFVKKALNMMKSGYAAIIIQNSAGSGKAREINKKILEKHTLLASIKMPTDIFIGKSGVETNIYVFKVNEKHAKDNVVKFIDFSNDGYARTNRKKASNNLKNADRAKERYEELVNLVRFGKNKLSIFTEKEYYEGNIDPKNGADWNQTAPIDTKPTLEDLKKTVVDYLAWEISSLLKRQGNGGGLGKQHTLRDFDTLEFKEFNVTLEERKALQNFKEGNIEFSKFKVSELFNVMPYKKRFDANKVVISENGCPYIVRTSLNNGVRGYINEDEQFLNDGNTISFGQDTATVFYQEEPYFTGDKIKVFKSKNDKFNKKNAHFFIAAITKSFSSFSWGRSSFNVNILENQQIELPAKDNQPDYEIMEALISVIQKTAIKDLILKISKEEVNENIQD